MTDSARGWSTWLIASLCLLFQFVVQLQPSAMIPALEADLSLGAEELGFLTSSYFISYLVCQIPSGWLLDRLGPRKVMAASSLLTAFGLVWFSLAESLESAVGARIALGVFGAPAFPAAALVASRWFASRRFTVMLGLTESFTLLGGVLVDLALPGLVETGGRSGSGVLLASIALFLGLACAFITRDRPSRGHLGPPSASDPRDPFERSLLAVMVDGRIWVAAFHGGLFFSVIAAFGGLWGVPFLSLRLGIDPARAAHVMALVFIAGALGAPLIGLVAARRRLRGLVLLASSIACSGAAFVLVYATDSEIPIYLALLVIGFFSGAYALDLALVVDVVADGRRGFAMGLANLVLGIVGGPMMLTLMGRGIVRSGADPSGSVLEASLAQVTAGLAWFAWGLALLVPLGFLLLLVNRALTRGPRD